MAFVLARVLMGAFFAISETFVCVAISRNTDSVDRPRCPASQWRLKVSKKAMAYYRTSSAANVGEDKDSMRRQQLAVEAYARGNDIEIVGVFNDEAVKGADPIDTRDGFGKMLAAINSNGCRRPGSVCREG
jgi:hypothetical protein